jgi:hypothetical protein
MIELIFTPDDSRTPRARGYATVDYASDAEEETVAETTEDSLSEIFEQAKADGETLDGADGTIDDAIDDPLAFRDYLIFEGGEIVFDDEYSRLQGGT